MKIDLENDLEKPGVGPFWETGNPELVSIHSGNNNKAIKIFIDFRAC